MIWVAGEIVDDLALRVSVLDRTFEHGLGLFETFRTWNGRAVTLPLQLNRLRQSASLLGLPVPDSADLPDQAAIDQLRKAEGHSGDVLLRLTMSAGSNRTPPVVWLTARPLPPVTRPGGALVRATWYVEATDILTMQKTLNYWRRRLLFEAAQREGLDEDLAICRQTDGITEGTRTNVFLVRGKTLYTPAASGAILPGVMRGLVLEQAARLGMEIQANQPSLSLGLIQSADELFLTNSVRGIIPVRCFETLREGNQEFMASGIQTSRIWSLLEQRLLAGEIP